VLLTCATRSTVAGQEEYPLPSDYLKIESVVIKPSHKLIPLRVTQRDPTERAGTPQAYYIGGANVSGSAAQVVSLGPIPDTNGTDDLLIFYRQLPATMSAGGQAPEVPLQWHDSLISYALWKTYRRWGKGFENFRDEAKQEWEQWMQKARRYTTPQQADVPTRITDTANYLSWGWE